MLCWGFVDSNCDLGVGRLGCFGGVVWLCLFLARRCGSHVESVFRSALSFDLSNGFDVMVAETRPQDIARFLSGMFLFGGHLHQECED